MKEKEKAPAYPFIRNDSGNFSMAEEDELMQMDIEQAIKTPRKSRPMWKNIGSKFGEFLFDNDIVENSALATKFAKDATEGIVPGCEIIEVIVYKDEDEENIFYFEIKYQRTKDRFIKTFTFPYKKG